MSPPTSESQSKTRKRQTCGFEIERFKKMQCSMSLKRLMVHRDGWRFMKSAGKPLQVNVDALLEPVMHLETIKWKLDKGFYINTDEFASDVREMFHNVTLQYSRRHEIHRIALRMSRYFEMNWTSLEERWAAEKEKENQTKKEKEKSKLKGRRVKHDSVNMKPNEDTIMASEDSLFGCKADLHGKEETQLMKEMQRKKERQVAREILHNTRRTVFIDHNKFYEEELRQLCGPSPVNNPLKKYCGLVLKD